MPWLVDPVQLGLPDWEAVPVKLAVLLSLDDADALGVIVIEGVDDGVLDAVASWLEEPDALGVVD